MQFYIYRVIQDSRLGIQDSSHSQQGIRDNSHHQEGIRDNSQGIQDNSLQDQVIRGKYSRLGIRDNSRAIQDNRLVQSDIRDSSPHQQAIRHNQLDIPVSY